jgi:hypothetical protein
MLAKIGPLLIHTVLGHKQKSIELTMSGVPRIEFVLV